MHGSSYWKNCKSTFTLKTNYHLVVSYLQHSTTAVLSDKPQHRMKRAWVLKD